VADRITVTIQDSQLDHLDDVTDKLRSAGMHVEQVFAPIGVIMGTASAASRSSIARVPGVAEVADETSFQIPGPGEKIQ